MIHSERVPHLVCCAVLSTPSSPVQYCAWRIDNMDFENGWILTRHLTYNWPASTIGMDNSPIRLVKLSPTPQNARQ